MGIPHFWTSLETLASRIWKAADDAWKVLRWIAASAAILSVYDQTLNPTTLALGIGLAVFAVGSLAALMYRWFIDALTEKGRSTEGWLTVVMALMFFLLAIGFAFMVWVGVAALYLEVLQPS
ncbi:hypothetical protein [uncultured Roseobacter sp.]|uniref:hypothetical protein n=1 Tax=uncultured Roseobacter sp. TaxID=114847 RepID=UPI002625E3CF|nr:hypothetical protein [uncultured Roseobacter sp.]